MRKLLTILILLAALGAWGWWIWQNKQHARPANVASGTIEADEIHVASRYGGRVEKLFGREGDALTNGQLIAELNAPELHAQRAEALALLADLEAGARKEELAAAKSEWESALAESELAQNEAKRAQDLFGAATISEIERDRATSRAAALSKVVTAAQSRYELLKAGARTQRVEQARAALQRIETQLAELRVTAPTNAVLEVLNVKVGDVAAPNRELATLILPQHLWIRVYVAQPQLGNLKLGQEVQFRADAVPGQSFRGEIEHISRSAEFTPRNVQTTEERVKRVFAVKIRLSNDAGELRPGMTGDVTF
ncbi:MAG TPA: efflux RND transporter periplasmic adaptor subunit [Opitutaceae bacterium]|nr:efflux RND transporter periplasmic adaptor subunit [Opitutaceae bacterium]